jgi:hypothetical protein
MIRVVHMMIIDRGQAREQNGSVDERPRALRFAENLLGIERKPFDRKFLRGVQSIPGKVARLRERAHLARGRRKLADSRAESSIEKFRE